MSEVDEPLVHICESCGVTKVMTPQEAHREGWDYPPIMGHFKMVSPRTCGKCGINSTLWWRLSILPNYKLHMTDSDHEVLRRILSEPESIRPEATGE